MGIDRRKILLQSVEFVLFYGICVIVLLWPAIYNKYPIIYPDTGTYIYSGETEVVPTDRPIMYGLFLRHTSMLFSLWLVVLSQALIFIFLLVTTLRSLFGIVKPYVVLLWCVAISGITTCGYYIGFVMPDIFSSYLLWALALLFYLNEQKGWAKLILFIIAIVSASVHNSNFLMMIVIAFVFAFYFLINKKYKFALKSLLLPISAFLFVIMVNFICERKIFFSKAPNVFLCAKLNETGLLREYLYEDCKNNDNVLCQYKDSLPNTLEEFLWGQPSIIERIRRSRGLSYDDACVSLEEEFRTINMRLLTNRNFGFQYLKIWADNFYEQLFNFNADAIPPMLEKETVYPLIVWYYDEELTYYRNSRQSCGTLDFSKINTIQWYSVIISLGYALILFVGILMKRIEATPIRKMLFFMIFGYLINNAICEFFSTNASRFSGRIIWFLPLIVLIDFYFIKRNRKASTIS